VPEAVVDLLETVQIEQQQREPGLVARGVGGCDCEAIAR
jgi:hypothetical protein